MSQNYCGIDAHTKKKLLALIDWLFNEVVDAGGDGDALWYSKFYDVKDIRPLIEEYQKDFCHKWHIQWGLNGNGNTIHWSDNQEGIIITNNEDLYNNAPSYQQVLIKY